MSGRGKKRKEAGRVRPAQVARLLGLVVFAGTLLAGGNAAWSWFQRPDVMPLSRVIVDGEMEHLRRDQLEAVVALAVWGNYFTVDIDAVRKAAASLPWVASATVRRVWPDALVIRVQERTPFARWGDAALVNGRGEIFRPSSLEGMEELPLLEGPDGQGEAVVARYRELEPAFAELGWTLRQLRLDDRGGWHLRLGEGPEIALGKESVETRLARALHVLRVLGPDAGRLMRIDARYTSGLAVRWKPRDAGGSADATAPVRG